MSIYEFNENDLLFNVIEAHPSCEFLIYDKKVYYNQKEHVAGKFASELLSVPNGYVSLYELNVDRNSDTTGLIYPFITKDGGRQSFKTTSTTTYDTQFAYGDTLTSSYPLSASITREYFASTTRDHVSALKNTLNYHTRLSPHYKYTSSFGDKSTQTINLISIPSIFYGSAIEKGTVDLKFYITGALVGHLKDENKNGELIQVAPTGSTGTGSVAGVVLYNEGFVLLTGSWTLNSQSIDYLSDDTDLQRSSWLYFGVGANDGATPNMSTFASSSYILKFNGTEKIPSLTMFAHMPAGKLNFSNNPTFIDSSSNQPGAVVSSSNSYRQLEQTIKNTISSSFQDPNARFKRQVYVSKIGIYDEDRNLIAIASLANPVKKREEDDYTFKLKLDM